SSNNNGSNNTYGSSNNTYGSSNDTYGSSRVYGSSNDNSGSASDPSASSAGQWIDKGVNTAAQKAGVNLDQHTAEQIGDGLKQSLGKFGGSFGL
ncbi:hypothetical protein BG003_011931, partial [Podila horticola]